MKKYKVAFIAALLLAASCKKEKTTIAALTANGIYITNEGDFNTGQGEISFYNPATDTVSNGLFSRVNGYHLGDVVQSIYIKDSTGFIVVNNSAKIEVVRIPSLKHIITITIPNSSPRYFLPINDSVGYVTDLYGSKIHVINYHTGSLITNISGVAEWTEHILMVNRTVVVEERSLLSTPSYTGSIITINPATHTLIQRYSFNGSNVDGMVYDHLNHIWFGMDADSVHHIPASIYCLNADMSLNKNIALGNGHVVSNLKINGTGDKIYYFDNDGVKGISISDTAAGNAFIPVNGRNFYGLGVDPTTGDVYVSDALDYVQPSRVYMYDKNANLIQSFSAGIISGNFAFSYE